MAEQVKALVPKDVVNACRETVRHYMREKNEIENRDPMDGFSSTYVSNITSYVAYMECDDNFNKSLVSMKNGGVKCGEVRFTCKSSIIAFFKHAVKNSVFASTTASGYRPAIQVFIDEIEHPDNHLDLSTMPELKKILKLQKKTRKHQQKVDSKQTDLFTKFNQRKLSSDNENKIIDLVWNYDMNELTFKNSMLFTSYWTPAFASFHRNKTHHSLHHENVIIDYGDGPYNLYPAKERREIFGVNLNEPSMYFLVMPYDTKKNSDSTEMCGFWRHKKVEQDVMCFTGLIIFYMHETSTYEDFNFHINKCIGNTGML